MSIRISAQGHVLVVTIDRPQAANALTRAMSLALADAWRRLRDDPDLRVGLLTGAGERAFCAGADLEEIGDWYRKTTPIERRQHAEHEPGLGGLTRNLDPGKPVVAAIGGHCLAGGLELALACDLRIASENATFGMPEVRRGIMPGAGGTQRLPRVVGLSVALEIVLTGDPIDAATALRVGLVNRVVPSERLDEEALALAHRIAANAPLAVQAARGALLSGLALPLAEGLRLEQLHAEPLRTSEDAKEGIAAFIERRDPVFRGR